MKVIQSPSQKTSSLLVPNVKSVSLNMSWLTPPPQKKKKKKKNIYTPKKEIFFVFLKIQSLQVRVNVGCVYLQQQ